jgi:hypothetical protein
MVSLGYLRSKQFTFAVKKSGRAVDLVVRRGSVIAQTRLNPKVAHIWYVIAFRPVLHQVLLLRFVSEPMPWGWYCRRVRGKLNVDRAKINRDLTVCSCRYSKSSAWVRSIYRVWRPYRVQL